MYIEGWGTQMLPGIITHRKRPLASRTTEISFEVVPCCTQLTVTLKNCSEREKSATCGLGASVLYFNT